ncbi:MAG: CBS domain-containing protein [Gammaproteobacteria bacterium]|jgi:CBS domain-containing protein|nr:CBS domain-containing protein [Gammaproteobacteria bacterium]
MRNVSQILERKGGRVVTIAEDQPVLEAVRLMAEHHIGAVLVLRGGELAGIASERDYARKVVLQGRSSSDTSVATIMSSPVVCVGPSESVNDCMAIMTERHIRHLPVLEGGRILGIVSIGDLVKEVIEDQKQEISYLQQYISS